ncbi:MAG: hypothetical protein Q4C98_09970 [Capnocytophaga sp.]|nr:hypothetical protein [Capnocytophaga sp.]
MKKWVFLSISLALFSCQKTENEVTEIKIGKEATSLTNVEINKLTERKILLSGGDGKYSVNIENSQFAQASINQDTLKIKGLLEGETFATITSNDKRARLDIKVLSQLLSLTQTEIRIAPKDENKSVSITGGSDIVEIKADDPDNMLEYKWNGTTSVIELKSRYEGVAYLTFVSKDSSSKVLKVISEVQDAKTEIGFYYTTSKFMTDAISFQNQNIIIRPGVGIWLSDSPLLKGNVSTGQIKKSIFVSEISNPVVDEYAEVEFIFYPGDENYTNFKSGKYKVLVKKINEKTIEIQGKGYRAILPRENYLD